MSRGTPIDCIPEKLVEKIQMILDDNGYVVSAEGKIDYGYQFVTASGVIINMYGTGKVVLQGKKDEKLKALIK